MQHSGATVLVGTGHAWGESVNLQDTDLALFVMLPWTPRAVTQWEGRFARLGQKRPVLISYIIAEGTVDEHVADVLLEKLPAVGKIAEDTNVEAIEKAFESDKSDLLSRVSAF
jgi:SNF2 family DNA or RNA helicase